MNDALRRAIERAVAPAGAGQWRCVGATGWGDAWLLTTAGARHFVKTAAGRHADMLACEADGLRALAHTRTVRVPAVIAAGTEGTSAYIALEWLQMRGAAGGAALGRLLARLHRAAAPRGPRGERFGWHRDNWIGGTPQSNAWHDDWGAFFGARRLAPQLALARDNGFDGALQRDGERVLAALPALLRAHAPAPSLLHGDLWSGNAATLADGDSAVFDPAVHVGDREADLAMTELFGGFGRDFRRAYEEAWPLDAGYPLRRDLYNLYHLLNHLNLFGATYLGRAEQTLRRLLAASR
ncbi:MAG TPA: fructosamine kinase family protein [Casimicrobiaceae bacterium]